MSHACKLKVDMEVFRQNWKYYSDNEKIGFYIENSKNGEFYTLDYRPYVEHLGEFGIPYKLYINA